MATVTITAAAQAEVNATPVTIQRRIANVAARLNRWPAVSGHKALAGPLAGSWRIRTGDYRVVFTVADADDGVVVTIWKVGHRGTVYD